MTESPYSRDADAPTGRMVDVLRNRSFLTLWLVQALSQTGQNMVNFALLILVRGVIDEHGVAQSNTAVGLAVLAFSSPAIIFSPIAGVLVERASKRAVLIITNVLRGVAALGFVLIQPDWTPILALVMLYLLAFGAGAVGQFFGPALGSAIPSLVSRREYVQANALINLTITGSQLLGFAALSPFLIRVYGVDSVIIGIVVIFLVCAGLSYFIPVGKPEPASQQTTYNSRTRRFFDEMREGGRIILDRPILVKAIAYLSLAMATYLMIATLGPEYVAVVLRLPVEDIAFILVPAGFGVIIGVLSVSKLTNRFGIERTIDWAIATAGIALVLIASVGVISGFVWSDPTEERTGALYIAGGLAVILGMSNAFILAPSQSLLQSRAPEHARARVWAAFFTVANGVAFIPIIFAGALADLFGVVAVMFGMGLILIVAGAYQIATADAEEMKPKAESE
ncbi:MAG: MFS transporter [Sphaerobacteraceae bacterium]|nr:MAG: MFS transporter [Sphaerobacteraceae bacterium]